MQYSFFTAFSSPPKDKPYRYQAGLLAWLHLTPCAFPGKLKQTQWHNAGFIRLTAAGAAVDFHHFPY